MGRKKAVFEAAKAGVRDVRKAASKGSKRASDAAGKRYMEKGYSGPPRSPVAGKARKNAKAGWAAGSEARAGKKAGKKANPVSSRGTGNGKPVSTRGMPAAQAKAVTTPKPKGSRTQRAAFNVSKNRGRYAAGAGVGAGAGAGAGGYTTYKRRTKSGKTITVRRKK